MKNIKNILNHLERVDKLIRLEATGTPNEFAVILGISRASLFRLLEELKNMNAPVKYDANKRTYYYEYPIKIRFFCQILKLDELNQIQGGKSNNLKYCYSDYYNYSEIIFKNSFPVSKFETTITYFCK